MSPDDPHPRQHAGRSAETAALAASDKTPPHRVAAVLAIGDELLTGQTLDSNSRWVSNRLAELGVSTIEHATLGDDAVAIAGAISRLATRCDLIVATGGLGPTADDLTRDGLAIAAGDALVRDDAAYDWLTKLFASRGRPIRDGNERQTMRPASGRMLHNAQGTAPGIHVVIPKHRCDVFALPGPPFEMRAMFEASIEPAIRRGGDDVIRVRIAKHVGIGESNAAAALGDLLDRNRNPLVGITASDGVITTRTRYVGPAANADDALAETAAAIDQCIGVYRFAERDVSVFDATIDLTRERNDAVIFAESCTAGLIAKRFTDVAGSSDAVLGGWVCYSNDWKMQHVGVADDVITQHGAVSEPVARDLAVGALANLRQRQRTGAQPWRVAHALSVTGIAGPDGGSEQKPVGTVFIGRASAIVETRDGWLNAGEPSVEVRRFHFPGDRERVRERTAVAAAAMLLAELQQRQTPTLLWQTEPDGLPIDSADGSPLQPDR
jgi:nicotinamide-nucleotide amidase